MLRVMVILYADNLSKEQVRGYLQEKFNYKGKFETRIFFHIHDNVMYIVTSKDNLDVNQGLCSLVSESEDVDKNIEYMNIELYEGNILERKIRSLERSRSIINSGFFL